MRTTPVSGREMMTRETLAGALAWTVRGQRALRGSGRNRRRPIRPAMSGRAGRHGLSIRGPRRRARCGAVAGSLDMEELGTHTGAGHPHGRWAGSPAPSLCSFPSPSPASLFLTISRMVVPPVYSQPSPPFPSPPLPSFSQAFRGPVTDVDRPPFGGTWNSPHPPEGPGPLPGTGDARRRRAASLWECESQRGRGLRTHRDDLRRQVPERQGQGWAAA